MPPDGRGGLVPVVALLSLWDVHRVGCRTPIPLDHQVVCTIIERGLIIFKFPILIEFFLGEVV
jgi:hypothetical protein